MCFFGHKWGVWSAPKGLAGDKGLQQRSCQRCGLCETRVFHWVKPV